MPPAPKKIHNRNLLSWSRPTAAFICGLLLFFLVTLFFRVSYYIFHTVTSIDICHGVLSL
jgi:hypothetical protein